jgi:DNA segregation ATPase FtsK/SpoIIIE, S-DNA-T family
MTVTLVTTATIDTTGTSNAAMHEDAVIAASAAAPIREILTRLADLVGLPSNAVAKINGHAVDAGHAMSPLGGSALRDGVIVSFDIARPYQAQNVDSRSSYLELRVVGGPAAGSIYSLAMGVTLLGRDTISGVRIDDPAVSRRHAVLTVTAAGVTVYDAGSRNGTTLDGASVGAEPVLMWPGMRLRVGASTVIVAAPDDPPVTVTSTTDGRLCFNRPPRLDAPDPGAARATVAFPAELVARAPNRLPLIALLAPLVAGVALAAVMRRPEYLLFTMLSPVMIASQWVSDRLGHRKSYRADRVAYAASFSRAATDLAAAVSRDAGVRRGQAPDPAALMKTVSAPSARLWERRRDDADFLVLRLGLGTLIAAVDVTGTRSGVPIDTPPVSDVPVTVMLAAIGVLGIAGSPQATAALGRALVGQLAALHSPRDVGVVLLTEPARVMAWEWVRWLPHVRPVSDLNCQALLGLDTLSASARVAELSALITARTNIAATEGSAASSRAIVVIVDGAQVLRRTPALTHVLVHGPRVGVYAICIDDEELRLPEECGAVTLLTDAAGTRMSLRTSTGATVVDVIADGVPVAWADHLARALAPLRDDSPDRSDALPDGLRWLDVAGVGDVGAELRTSWRNAGGGTTAVLVGAATEGKFVIDIAHDGPHALIAGTTGSGKSELLQTLVASLAVANRPDDLTFVLIDYKGGAAFGACATLPHTVGMVTDLDGRLVERALISLGAELKRREALLATVGAPDIAAFRAGGGELARLVIVVDEFASLAEELPTFVGGLVGIAQRGRSLGVHLVLATQRPEGVVSADIRANTNLRICLAVMRDSESRDVIDAPDAARISRATPGRGYARTGHNELIAFQSGRIGGRSTAADEGEIDVRLSPFRALCEPAPARRERIANDSAETDLDRIVTACRDAARSLGITAAPSPWLPPLPDVISVAGGTPRPLTAVLGVLDVPTAQGRQPHLIDLATLGHQVIAGSARSGRTTALRTLIGSLATSTPCDALHVYAVDCSGGSLSALSALPHCGAVVSAHEPARALRLFSMLTAELDRRQATTATPGHGNVGDEGQLLPHIVVLIDGWESFTSAFEDVDAGAVIDACTRLLREGASVGLHVVVTADRAGLVGRLASIIENRLVLRLADRTDFSLIGLPVKAVPVAMPAGRGFLADSLLEVQVCILGHDSSTAAQLAALAAVATAAQLRDAGVPRSARPRRIDPLPVAITAADIEARDGPASPGSALVTLGVGGDELSAVVVDLLDAGPGFVVAGPHRSGRSTALATIADALRATGWRVVAVSPRQSILRDHASDVVESHGPELDELLGLVDGRLAVIVDDAELITDSPVAGVLDRFIRTARDAGHLVVIAGSVDELAIGFRGFLVDARRARSGILLNPRSSLDGEVLAVRLPRSTGGAAPPGRGLLVVRGSVTHLQVALPAPHSSLESAVLRNPLGQPQTVTDRVPIAAPPCIAVTLTTPSSAPV